MDTLHIGGVADGELHDITPNVVAGRQSFKYRNDFPSDHLRHDNYARKCINVRDRDGTVRLIELMVLVGMKDQEVVASVEAKLNVVVLP